MIEPATASSEFAALLIAARVFGVLLFGASAMGKATHFGDFANAIAGYRLLPAWSHRLVAMAVLVCEAAVTVALLFDGFAYVAALLAIVMLLVFGGAMILVLWRGDAGIDCGCSFGPGGGARIDPMLIGRNLFFAAILVPAVLWRAAPGTIDAMTWVDGIGFACACILLGKLVEQLARIRQTAVNPFGGQT